MVVTVTKKPLFQHPPTGFSTQVGPGPMRPQPAPPPPSYNLPNPPKLPPPPPLPQATAKPKGKPLKKVVVKRAREQSSIAFPYMDLDTAVTVARAFVANGGGSHTRDQLAGALGQSPLSGAFIMKLSAARQFGLVDFVDGKFKLTDLGFSIIDKNESREKSAKVQAFLNVELYRKIYEDFKGKQLPPRPLGLEQTFVQMGVAPKQKTNARLAFDKSARQAGFSTLDPDRLIEPMVGAGVSKEHLIPSVLTKDIRTRAFDSGMPNLDPLIAGLLSRLPSPGKAWSVEKRKKWLQTFEANLEMIYPTVDEGADQSSSEDGA